MNCRNLHIITITILVCMSSAALAEGCNPTPHRTTGTHYQPVTEQKSNIGKGLIFEGRVLSTPDCKPVAQARVAHWQADQYGHYTDELRAYLFTDAQGRFRFETQWPNLRPPHIHFIVTKDGYHTLETQWRGSTPVKNADFNLIIEAK